MKTLCLYLRIIKRCVGPVYPMQKNYEDSTRRFLDTYLQFRPTIPHDVLIVNCGSYKQDDLLDPIATDYVTSVCTGFDCGTYKEVNYFALKYDFVVAMNTHVYFWRHGWLEALVNAAKANGPGFYGPSASLEYHPHLRTPCICYHPGLMQEYPLNPKNRDECGMCEAGPDNFSLWAHKKGHPSMLVTADGQAWKKEDWRKPANIFRRGDQSNVLVYDRHTEIYHYSTGEARQALERAADGVLVWQPPPQPTKTTTTAARRI